MVALIIGMLVCVGLALAVVAMVAIPARREGRELLSPQGEELVALVKERAEATVEKTGDALTTARDKVSDKVSDTVGSVGTGSGYATDGADDSGRHRAAS
jgi:hypothetical protein